METNSSTPLAKTLGQAMRELLQSPKFSSNEWRLFYALACRLQPSLEDSVSFPPAPIIEELGFQDVASFVLAPVSDGGLQMEPEKWQALQLAVKALEQIPDRAKAGYTYLSLANLVRIEEDLASNNISADAVLNEYRHALNDGLGRAGNDYTLTAIQFLNGLRNVGVGHCVKSKSMILLVDKTANNHEAKYLPLFLLDCARELTERYRTLVVPDQSSTGVTYWAGDQRGPVMVYHFKLADSPPYLTA